MDESGTLLHSLEGYITLIVQLSGIHGDVNKPRPPAVAHAWTRLVYCQ